METTETLGLTHFLAQSDTVGKAIFAILVAMSVASWYFIAAKSLQGLIARRRTALFLESFWNALSLHPVELQLKERRPDEPFSRLVHHALASSRHHARHGAGRLNEAGSAAEFLTRSMRRVIDEETAALEWGLTVLSSVGITAPFVGLFGTVWSVYHALVKTA